MGEGSAPHAASAVCTRAGRSRLWLRRLWQLDISSVISVAGASGWTDVRHFSEDLAQAEGSQTVPQPGRRQGRKAPGPHSTGLSCTSDHDMPASTALCSLQIAASITPVKRTWCKLPLSTGAGTTLQIVLGRVGTSCRAQWSLSHWWGQDSLHASQACLLWHLSRAAAQVSHGPNRLNPQRQASGKSAASFSGAASEPELTSLNGRRHGSCQNSKVAATLAVLPIFAASLSTLAMAAVSE